MLALTTLLLTISGDVNVQHGARLLDEPPAFAQVEEQPLPRTSIPQLEVDIRALERMRPSLGGAGALFGIGGGAALGGGMLLFIGAVTSGFASLQPLLIAGAIGLGLGVSLVAIGVWLVVDRLNERARINETLIELKRQLAEQRRGGYSLQLPVTVPMATVASF